MADESRIKVHVDRSGSMGLVWFMGWLFAIGFLHLGIPKALYALLLWPYYLGVFFGR